MDNLEIYDPFDKQLNIDINHRIEKFLIKD